jgi:hypothetical protein
LFELSIAIGNVVLLPGGARRRSGYAVRRLDLDHVGACLGHQQGRVRPLEDLAEIEDDDPGEGSAGSVGHAWAP